MRKTVYVLLFFGLALAGFWVFNPFFLRDRLHTFLTQMPEGKNYQNELEKQNHLYTAVHEVVFLGDSHMEQCEWQEFFPEYSIANRGIGGDGTASLTARTDAAVRPGTGLVFLQIGVNDLLSGLEPEKVFEDYKHLIAKLQSLDCRIVATLPFYIRYGPEANAKIKILNQSLAGWLPTQGVAVLDLNPQLAENDRLRKEMSLDGVHLNATGYQIWIRALRPVLQDWKPMEADSL